MGTGGERADTGWTVAGLGSPHGDDVLGWRVAGAVAARLGTEAVLADGAARLLPALAAARRALVVDAAAGLPPGAVRELPPEALRRGARLSSHGLALAEALAAARAAGGAREVRIFGVGVAPEACRPGAPPSRGLDAVAARAARAVLAALTHGARGEAGGEAP